MTSGQRLKRKTKTLFAERKLSLFNWVYLTQYNINDWFIQKKKKMKLNTRQVCIWKETKTKQQKLTWENLNFNGCLNGVIKMVESWIYWI